MATQSMKRIVVSLSLTAASAWPAFAQTYYGVLATPANTGPGGSCCTSVSSVDATGLPVPGDGTCVGCSVINKTQYDAYHTATGMPFATNAAHATKIVEGITLTCSATPSLSATYAVDTTTMTLLNTIVGFYVANGNSFPPSAATLTIQDTSGGLHTFPSLAAFQSFYKAVAVYWAQLSDWKQRTLAGQTPTVPPATSSAC